LDPALSFPLTKDRKVTARAWLLNPDGHPSDLYYSSTAVAEICGVMAEFRPHVVVIERLWLHRYIDCVKSFGCRVVLDNHNVESALYRQIGESVSGEDLQARLLRDTIPARTETIERKASQAVDQVWVCSREDERLMSGLYAHSAPVHVVPNGIDVQHYSGIQDLNHCGVPDGTDRKAIVLPAAFAYPPNSKAALFLIQKVWPCLSEIATDCRLLLVGSSPTPEMMTAAQGDSRIVITGAVPDVRPYITAASAMVVPLFEGGGTRFKILEAFASKTPVVSTATGAAGLRAKPGVHFLIAGSASDFVDGLKQLWADERLAAQLTEDAFRLVTRFYSWNVASRKIEKAVQELTDS
jgi:glycosyltransferase involved in cell wall biosynthesis